MSSEPFTYVWEFHVPPQHAAEFERHYGADGTWVGLFSRAPGYLGTLFLEDRATSGRYLTVDRWESEATYRAFRAQFAKEYDELDRQCAGLTIRETSLGNFKE